MSKTYRVGVAALVHDHVWGELRHWAALPNVELVAAGDVNPPLLERVQREYGVPRVYPSWQEMLEQEELDIVQAAAENNAGADIVEAAAAKGCHVISEKPMAARLSQAERMLQAAETAGTLLLINWPTAWNPAFVYLTELVRAGEIGRPFYLKNRSAHNGPKEIGCSRYFYEWLYDEEKNGAGALMDYCCYGAKLCAYLLGLPEQVTGFRGCSSRITTFRTTMPLSSPSTPRLWGSAKPLGRNRSATLPPIRWCTARRVPSRCREGKSSNSDRAENRRSWSRRPCLKEGAMGPNTLSTVWKPAKRPGECARPRWAATPRKSWRQACEQPTPARP
ncbi:MAG TPA: Gfo/Idh/MocA family oxidoreductase [Armatimonadetes bacterium]|nr:Gfo/Idh/MocA family oxidoreductase [Armatimonadota bacterium]